MTPHRFTGPHDISKYFDKVATGFHLKEYTYKELYYLFKSVGFRKIQFLFRIKSKHLTMPVSIAIIIELLIAPLPYSFRKNVSNLPVINRIIQIKLIAIK